MSVFCGVGHPDYMEPKTIKTPVLDDDGSPVLDVDGSKITKRTVVRVSSNTQNGRTRYDCND